MADAKTEKQKVKEITGKLKEGLKELFECENIKDIEKSFMKQWMIIWNFVKR